MYKITYYLFLGQPLYCYRNFVFVKLGPYGKMRPKLQESTKFKELILLAPRYDDFNLNFIECIYHKDTYLILDANKSN